MSNTTNHLDDGEFSDLKNRIRVHGGLSKELNKEIVDFFMLHNGKNSKIPTLFSISPSFTISRIKASL